MAQSPLVSSDVQVVLTFNEGDGWLAVVFWQSSNDRVWTPYQFDLRAYAGRTIKLHFGVQNDGADAVTGMYVDGASVKVCPTGASL